MLMAAIRKKKAKTMTLEELCLFSFLSDELMHTLFVLPVST